MEKDEVVDTNLLMEGKGSLTTILNIIEYPKAVEGEVDVLFPGQEDYNKAIEVMARLYEKGTPVPAVDVILAAMCLNRKLALRTRDRHFKVIAEAFPGFKVRLEK
ncbi:MAG: PIN domain-containing protein [Euryarchaeota archaeon]|nr:PIN domain-containing protein [Euryarchaeota archaeon]